jgi:NAD(P)-dependent dehydrogenase (short-subunit alcohol dehydrogenase family)
MMAKNCPNVRDLFVLGEKVALVTGAASGIGYEVAKGLLEAGAKVAVASRSYERARRAAREMMSLVPQSEAIGLKLDVRNERGVNSAFAQVSNHWGRLDVLETTQGVPRIPVTIICGRDL